MLDQIFPEFSNVVIHVKSKSYIALLYHVAQTCTELNYCIMVLYAGSLVLDHVSN